MPDSSNMCCLIQPLIHWVGIHQVLVGWLSVFSIITFFGTLLIIPIMVVRLPEDYFLYDKAHLKEFRRQHPFIRVLSGIFKNILGYLFILAGIAMLFLPGQGILTILIGITLISFPKKRALELWFIRHESIHQALNWMRAKAGKPYLRLQ